LGALTPNAWPLISRHSWKAGAMGHGLGAAMMASVAIAAYRHARRGGADLHDHYAAMNHAVASQFSDDQFVTVQMAALDVGSGRMRWVNAGHLHPLLLRGHRVVRTLDSPTTLPLPFGGVEPAVSEEALEPGAEFCSTPTASPSSTCAAGRSSARIASSKSCNGSRWTAAPGGGGLHLLATVLPHPPGPVSAPPDDAAKITSRCGEQAVEELNEALVIKAAQAKVLRMHKVRADTTVVEANVAYPVDSSLLAKGVARLAKLARRAKAQGLAQRTKLRDRSRGAHRRAREVVNSLRRRDEFARDELRRLNAKLARTAAQSVREAEAVVRNVRRKLRSLGPTATGRARADVDQLEQLAERVRCIAEQTRRRAVQGETPDGATRLVSLHDPDARPIRKGRLGRPVEFGYKGQIVDNADGVILDWSLQAGNPADAAQLVPAIERIQRRTGKMPRAVTADRRYGEARRQRTAQCARREEGRHPSQGSAGSRTSSRPVLPAVPANVRWRTGAEGRISCMKRDFGCRRTRMDTLVEARTWTGHGVFAHNLRKIAGLIS
jgi:IS5 family transposase